MPKQDGPDMAAVEERVEEILRQLTLREKVALLSGRDTWRTAAIERLGIPSLTMTDGPHGVRTTPQAERLVGPATSFPTGVAMASSWNPDLIERIGAALGEETRAMGGDILLGPCVNIVRVPLAGRNFESYAEDPYLAGRIGVAFVMGVQSRNVGTSLKHYACNNQEIERDRGSSIVDERTLREIYLPAFETVVKEAKPWTVMCSYNRINGVYASENAHLLQEILKDEWGFGGVVISDWGANHTTVESVKGGLDIEMPGPAKYYGEYLAGAVNHWQIEAAAIEASVRRILRMLIISGKMDGSARIPPGSVNTPEHQKLARELAEESITLLKNEAGILPLRPERLRSIAILGPNAADIAVSGGGSACLEPPYRVGPLQALRAKVGTTVRIEHERGCDNYVEPPVLRADYLVPAKGAGRGLSGEYFNNPDLAGNAVLERLDRRIDFWWPAGPDERLVGRRFSARWTGRLVPTETGRHTFALGNTGRCRLYLEGKLLMEGVPERASDDSYATASAQAELTAGRPCEIRVEYTGPAGEETAMLKLAFAYTPTPEEDDRIGRAVRLAEEADVAVIFAGMPEGYETEGADRPDLGLPGRQNELIERVAAVNRNTIVVLNCGAPVSMPWLADVAAVVDAFYPGQEGGNALAGIILGEVNPSGKLSVTFPKRLEDTPTFINYPGAREVHYGEGIFVGYRYYDRRDIEPLFPFGHGLSYTTFAYGEVAAPRKARIGEPVHLAVTVKNTGKIPGKEVIQVYTRDKKTSLARPPKELKAFAKVPLQPGEATTVNFLLDQRAFAFYDPSRKQWVVEPGEFELLVGSSSRDIRGEAPIDLVE